MKKNLKSLTVVIVVLMLLLQILAGCTNTNEPSTSTSKDTSSNVESSSEGPDISQTLNLKGYLMGAAPAGLSDVVTELNKKLLEDINATVEINYIGWGDREAKYPLILATGTDFDFIFAANWNYYIQEARKGAFAEITEDMIKKNMPTYYETINKAAFEEVKVDGKIFMLPTPNIDPLVTTIAIRGDLRKKYGVEEVTKFSELGQYLKAIKENEPNMIPMMIDGTFDAPLIFSSLMVEQGTYIKEIVNQSYQFVAGLYIKSFDNDGKIYSLTDEPIATQFKNAAVTMKSWYDNGYINRDVYANTIISKDAFAQGKSAIAIGNTIDIQQVIGSEQLNGWEVEYIPGLDADGKFEQLSYLSNGIGMPRNGKNMDRTMMLMDLLMCNPDYNRLVYYGIEGKNYVFKGDLVGLPEGVTMEQNTYPPDAAGFWFTDKRQLPGLETWTDSYIAYKGVSQQANTFTLYAGFGLDTTEIRTELANISTVAAQYGNPLLYGMVQGSIDDAIATLNEKLKAAGQDKVKEQLEAQIQEYLNK